MSHDQPMMLICGALRMNVQVTQGPSVRTFGAGDLCCLVYGTDVELRMPSLFCDPCA